MYYIILGAAAVSMVCGPLILRWIRSRRLKRELSLFQYACARPISHNAPHKIELNATASQDHHDGRDHGECQI